MSRFNKTYKYEQELEKVKKYLTQSREKEAEKILKKCYEYFADEHLIIKKLDTIKYLIDVYLTLNDFNKVKSLFIEYESESKEHGLEIPPEMFHNFGRFYSNEGEIEKSIASYKKAIEKYLTINDPLHAAISYLNLGEKLREIGDFNQAAIAFINSRNIFLQYNKGDLALNPLLALIEMLIKLRGKTIPVDLGRMESVLERSEAEIKGIINKHQEKLLRKIRSPYNSLKHKAYFKVNRDDVSNLIEEFLNLFSI